MTMQLPEHDPSPRRNLYGYLIVAILFLSIGFSSGLVTDRLIHAADNVAYLSPAGSSQDMQLISDARNIIQKNYVEHASLGPNQLTYGAISGMVDSLGDTGHSRFLDPSMLQSESNFNQGEFEGIGAEVEMKDGHVVIVAPMDGSPAEKAGVHAGDIVIKVDGQDVTGQSLQAVVQHILGPAGTQVTITLLDLSSGEQRDVTITRARILIHNVTWSMLPGTTIAHLRIAAFSNGVSDDLKQALKEIKAQHATGLVLDLRNDPGGLLDEAVAVSSQFLKNGSVLQEKNAQGEIKVVQVKSGGLATDIPMEVLINQGTASAAEIVSGALQDAGRAKLVGQTTFGTGTVLNQFNLPDGSAILLATEEWLTPKGRLIWHQGIEPDISIELAANAEPLTPEGEKGLTLSQLQNSGDSQLLSAIQLLEKVAGEQITALVH
jgi:carboxyl-terminal processing protease